MWKAMVSRLESLDLMQSILPTQPPFETVQRVIGRPSTLQRIAAGPRSLQIVNTETNDRDPLLLGRTSAPSGARRTR